MSPAPSRLDTNPTFEGGSERTLRERTGDRKPA